MSDVLGADRLYRKLARVPAKARDKVFAVNAKNGEDLGRIARVLVPHVTGVARAAIQVTHPAPGVARVDFGPLARVFEGGRKAGVSKKGRPYPAMSPRPFVNPALRVTRKKRRAALRRAINLAIKEAGGG